MIIEANAKLILSMKCLLNNFSEQFLQSLTDKLYEKRLAMGETLFEVYFFNYIYLNNIN